MHKLVPLCLAGGVQPTGVGQPKSRVKARIGGTDRAMPVSGVWAQNKSMRKSTQSGI